MLTKNICTEAGLTNGATGVVYDFILPPNNYRYLPGQNTIVCTKPPIIITFRGINLDGVIPIFPTSSFFSHKIIDQSFTMKIKRHQFPILGGYAFTDYKVQGKSCVLT